MKKQAHHQSGGGQILPLFFGVFFSVLLIGGGIIFILKVWDSAEQSPSDVAYKPEVVTFPKNEYDSYSEDLPSSPTRYGDVLSNPELMADENIYTMPAASPDKVVLTFGGDILLDDEYSIMSSYKAGGIERAFSEGLLEEMRGADICMVNNEFTYTLRGEPIPEKQFVFRANPSRVNILQEMGVDAVSLANNHAFDYGEISLLDTLDTLKTAGIKYAGAGRNISEAATPLYFIVNDMKIAIICATQIERTSNPDTRGASENRAGVFRCMEPALLIQQIETAKANSDFVILYVHWGTENTTELDWLQTSHAPKYAAAGADIIIGDHSHCLQGISYIGDTPIFYSLSNFWFNSKSVNTCLIKLTLFENGEKSIQFLPARQESCRTSLLYGNDGALLIDYMRGLSPEVYINDEGFVSNKNAPLTNTPTE